MMKQRVYYVIKLIFNIAKVTSINISKLNLVNLITKVAILLAKQALCKQASSYFMCATDSLAFCVQKYLAEQKIDHIEVALYRS